ncbi:phage shock protein PspD [Erwinia amylovora]|uniref:Phage shock protein D n=4 Tax=Erwinia amylovora TaxID=552 RepID=A0A830ZYT7_ERWAM|nr:phage shock protein PspD [Erwinia amylovora]CBX80746.1 Phage shock protein D [Erwinia amylovora ATCC BAA-2158]CCP03302.1 Phage shock protein D [Erwinia amylovora Ea644]CCP07312.1 Phage shock protein D [Erwinia amylovora MR1]CDK15351.1 Phage shock protein D [Erwinia amylovora LA635]CDK18717.1 Phage shock protein D [Erwinia amylovora LA636]CDK22087.1 Phage shock protein D [Erwinia amylovora LA637]
MRHLKRHAPVLQKAGKFILINALTYGPAGLSGWAVKSVARKPLKIFLAWALEPLIRRALKGASSRWVKP